MTPGLAGCIAVLLAAGGIWLWLKLSIRGDR